MHVIAIAPEGVVAASVAWRVMSWPFGEGTALANAQGTVRVVPNAANCGENEDFLAGLPAAE
jgi:hypothetical protein